ncbi:hypothetical protein FO519_008711 [Halicephalobus sp. NKZ332]|nr:hypothetical protein FO519_008711 [Halicephalobus sp. NKZ332]
MTEQRNDPKEDPIFPESEPLVHIQKPKVDPDAENRGSKENNETWTSRWAVDPKMQKFVKFSKMCQLNRLFGHIGRWVAINPYAFLISALIMSSLCVGMFKMELRDRVRDGYTPTTSPSRRETDILRNFFGSKSDPIMTIVLLLARDKGSMHRPEYMAEASRIHEYIKGNISITVNNDEFTFYNICKSACQVNYFFEFLATEFDKIATGEINKNVPASKRLDFPITKIYGIDMHFERNLFGVKVAENETENHLLQGPLAAIHNYSNIRGIEIIQLNYKGDAVGVVDEEDLARWEMALYKYSREEFKSDLIELLVIGSEIVDYEMNKESQMMGRFVGLGFALMIIFAIGSNALNSYYYQSYSFSINIVSIVATLCSLLSVGVTLGLYGIVGMRVNSVMLIMPFLTLGIGVNDSFMLAHAYFRHKRTSPNVVSLMQSTYAEVGPSITITTLTNVVTFLIGAMMPTAEFQLFCTAAAMALGYCYIFTVVCFGPTLAIIHRQKPLLLMDQVKIKMRDRLHSFCEAFVDGYSKVMCSRLFHMFNFVVFTTYMGFAIYGTINISAKLDTEKILPGNSVIKRPHQMLAHKVWFEYYPLQIFINKPFNLTNVQQMNDFDKMMEEYYSIPNNKGRRYTTSWLDEYKRYFNDSIEIFNFDFHSEDGVTKDQGERPATGYDLRFFKGFLSNPIYKHYESLIKYTNASDWENITINQFTLTLVYAGLSDWQGRIDIMIKWRQIASKYEKSLDVSVWESNGMFVDQMLSLKQVSLQSGLLTILCMLIVCIIFIQNPLGVLAAVSSIGSIVIGVIGYLYFWDLDLDPASLGAILMSVGMSVDFTAHTIYAYLRKKRHVYENGRNVVVLLDSEFERMKNCVSSIMYPMFQGGLSTVVCVMPLLCIPDYIPLVFFKTIVLVVIFGLYHGCVVLPGFMVLFTPVTERWYENLKKRFSNKKENHAESESVQLTSINKLTEDGVLNP